LPTKPRDPKRVVFDEIRERQTQCFRRELRHSACVLHLASSGEGARDLLGSQVKPQLIAVLSDIIPSHRIFRRDTTGTPIFDDRRKSLK